MKSPITQGYKNSDIQAERALWSTEKKRLEGYNNSLTEACNYA